jgi:hypothetical protein
MLRIRRSEQSGEAGDIGSGGVAAEAKALPEEIGQPKGVDGVFSGHAYEGPRSAPKASAPGADPFAMKQHTDAENFQAFLHGSVPDPAGFEGAMKGTAGPVNGFQGNAIGRLFGKFVVSSALPWKGKAVVDRPGANGTEGTGYNRISLFGKELKLFPFRWAVVDSEIEGRNEKVLRLDYNAGAKLLDDPNWLPDRSWFTRLLDRAFSPVIKQIHDETSGREDMPGKVMGPWALKPTSETAAKWLNRLLRVLGDSTPVKYGETPKERGWFSLESNVQS